MLGPNQCKKLPKAINTTPAQRSRATPDSTRLPLLFRSKSPVNQASTILAKTVTEHRGPDSQTTESETSSLPTILASQRLYRGQIPERAVQPEDATIIPSSLPSKNESRHGFLPKIQESSQQNHPLARLMAEREKISHCAPSTSKEPDHGFLPRITEPREIRHTTVRNVPRRSVVSLRATVPRSQVYDPITTQALEIVRMALIRPLIKNNRPPEMLRVLATTETLVSGDIHGQLAYFAQGLFSSLLIGANGHWLTPEERAEKGGNPNKISYIQIGDSFDRGPHSFETLKYLLMLQKEALSYGDEFVIILGNHELMFIEENWKLILTPYNELSVENREKLEIVCELINGIKTGSIKASYSDAHRLYTHAGLTPAVLNGLAEESYLKIRSGNTKQFLESPSIVSLTLNNILKSAIATFDFSHKVFGASRSRNGTSIVPGHYWADASDHPRYYQTEFDQVFGHTASTNILRLGKYFRIDTGMAYGSIPARVRNEASLEIHQSILAINNSDYTALEMNTEPNAVLDLAAWQVTPL